MDVLDRIRVLRSKNAGPHALTFDIIFREEADFARIKERLRAEVIAAAFHTAPPNVLSIEHVDELRATKFSLRRPHPCGHPGDSDCYGMNQEEPVARLLDRLLS